MARSLLDKRSRSSHRAPPHLMTAEELFALADGDERYERYELVRGELREEEMAGWQHSWVGLNILLLLANDPDAKDAGRVVVDNTAYVLARHPDTVRIPDVSFVRHERLPPPLVSGRAALAPDLAVEIRSPNDLADEPEDKLADYFTAGVRLVWIVDPDTRTVEVWPPDRQKRVLSGEDVIDGSDVIPGFQCSVARFFEGVAGT